MPDPTPRIDNIPYRRRRHGSLTVEGWSRAGVQSCWQVPELKVGFDLGAIPWDFTPTPTWLVSHAHLDHLMALPGLVARRSMLKLDPPRVFVPAEVVDDVRGMLAAWSKLDGGEQKCDLVGLRPGDVAPLSQTHEVLAFATEHRVPSRGYVVRERRRKLRPELAGLPGVRIKELRDAGESTTIDTLVPLVAYTGDTAPAGLDAEPSLYEATILIAEMSFARPEHSKDRIHAFGHLHLDDFAERADRFRNELIIAAHVTTRDDPATFQRWVAERLPVGLRERVVVWE